MDHATAQTRIRVWRIALLAVAAAFAWVVLSVVLGLGASDAHADDSDSDTLLGGIADTASGVVEGAVDAAAGTVAQVVTEPPAPVVQPVAAVVQPVAQPVTQAVAPAVAPVVQSIAETGGAVTAPVQAAAGSGIVSAVTTPVVEAVSAVPVVGEVSEALGVDDAVGALAGTGDHVVGIVVDVPQIIADTAVEAAGSLAGTSAGAVIGTVAHGEEALPGPGPAGAASTLTLFESVPGAVRAYLATVTGFATVITAVVFDAGPLGTAHDLPGGSPPLTSAFSSPGGAGLGMGALLALGLIAAHRAWVRRSGLENDDAPPAPALLTDVSPD